MKDPTEKQPQHSLKYWVHKQVPGIGQRKWRLNTGIDKLLNFSLSKISYSHINLVIYVPFLLLDFKLSFSSILWRTSSSISKAIVIL